MTTVDSMAYDNTSVCAVPIIRTVFVNVKGIATDRDQDITCTLSIAVIELSIANAKGLLQIVYPPSSTG